MYLDVSRLPRDRDAFDGNDDIRPILASILIRSRGAIEAMARAGLIKANMSFGFAAAKPHGATSEVWDWDDPYSFTWLVSGWGPDSNRYIANAVRKLRPALREHSDTLFLRVNRPNTFKNVVESADGNGRFLWGDFPWGGATFVHIGGMIIPAAVSCLLEVEDDAIAKLIGGLIGAEILKVSKPEEFGPNS